MTIIEPYLELLSDKHQPYTKGFNCGDEDHSKMLNDYLYYEALSEQEESLMRTYVLVGNPVTGDEEAIIGYFSLKAAKERVHLPDGQKKHVPVVEVSALARDLTVKGRGYGGELLLEAIKIAYEVSLQIGVSGLFLNYTKQGKRLYEEFGFYEFSLPGNEKTMFLPVEKIREILNNVS